VTEEHVATREYERAVFSSREIDLAAGAFELVPVRGDFAVNAKARDAAVGIDLETKVCDAFFVVDWKRIFAVAGEWHLREQWYPLDVFAGQFCVSWEAGESGAFEGAVFRVVATEVAGVDDDAAHDSWEAETNDAPIEARGAASTTLPAVHPLAAIRVLAFDKDGRARLQQVLFGREEVVVGDEHRATQPLRRQIYQFSKIHLCTQKAQRAQSITVYFLDQLTMYFLISNRGPPKLISKPCSTLDARK
jgi:hypothetical protein